MTGAQTMIYIFINSDEKCIGVRMLKFMDTSNHKK